MKGTGFSRFEIDLNIPLFLRRADTVFEKIYLVSGTGNVMTATHVEPLHLGQDITECRLYCFQGRSQIIRILFTQCMEMESVEERFPLVGHHGIPLLPCRSQPAAGSTGVINIMSVLGRPFRINPEAYAPACYFCLTPEAHELAWRIEYDVVCIVQ